MSHRTPLVAAVVGALLVGGAATGSTHALWRASASITAGSLTSGAMSMTVNADQSVLGSVTLQPGAAGVSVETTIKDTSLDGSKNLTQRFRVASASFSSTGGLSDGDLTLSVMPKPDGGCPTTAPTSTVSTYTSEVLSTTAPATPDETVDVCVTVAAASTAAAGSGGVIELGFVGEQVRSNGDVTGWSTPIESRTVTVTIAHPASTPGPAISCGTVQDPSGQGVSNQYIQFSWAGQSGNAFRVDRISPSGPSTPITNAPYEFTVARGDIDGTTTYAVVETTGGTDSSPNYTVTINKSSGTMTCSAVAP